jgi:DNA repair protein RadC
MNLLPREKLQIYGPKELLDHELFSILLSTGSKKENVFSLSQRIIKGFDREEIMVDKNLDRLSNRLSIGKVQTSRIMAAIEIGRRLFDAPTTRNQIRSYEDVYEILKNMQHLKKEYVRGLYLNSRNTIIRDEIISIGSLDSNIIHPREIFKPAIEYSAYAIIIAHNHPSGVASPSQADIQITKQLIQLGELLQIPILDHIIIGENDYFSFGKEKLLLK